MAIKEMQVRMLPGYYQRGQEIMYLTIDELQTKHYGELFKKAPDEAFFTMVEKHVDAYMQNGTMPPAPIASAILNAVDDIRAGRKIAIRSGDYIALQSFNKMK